MSELGEALKEVSKPQGAETSAESAAKRLANEETIAECNAAFEAKDWKRLKRALADLDE